MIKQIIELLKTDDFYGVSEEVDIAKGKYKVPQTVKEGIKKVKRDMQWQKKKQ